MDFLQSGGWVLVLVGFIMILSIARIMTSEPQYSMKEILKKPWLIFKLLSKAAEETLETLDEVKEVAEDVKEKAEEVQETVEDTVDTIKETVDEVKDSVDEFKQ